jgi:putative peptidoglycan lipid II flippase
MATYLKSALVVSISTLMSRILGMVRDIALASVFGASMVLDAFLLAFTIPNLFRRLFGEGALSAAFIPVFSDTLEKQGKPAAFALTNKVLSLMLVVLGIIVVIAILASALLYTSGWLEAKNELATGLLAVMMPYMLLMCLAAIMGAALNAMQHFLSPALSPCVLNIAWLLGLFLVAPCFGTSLTSYAYTMAVAVVVGGVCQMFMQWPPLHRRGMRLSPSLDYKDASMKTIFANMGPVVIGSLVLQINVLLDRLIAWWLIPYAGALTVLYMGDRLMEFPLAIIGISLATVVFPLFSQHVARHELEALAKAIPQAVRMTLLLSLPASIGLAMLASPLISLIYQHNRFSTDAALRTVYVVIAYAAGLWAYILIHILSRAFYAWGDTLTPMRVSCLCVGINLGCKLLLVLLWQETGLAIATSLGAFLNVALLLRMLRRKITLTWQGMPLFLLKTILACAVMGSVLFLLMVYCAYPLNLWGKIAGVLVPTLLGMAVYFAMIYLLRVPEIKHLRLSRKKY